MRFITLSLLISSFFTSAFATEYVCKDSYDKKLERIEANRTVRMIGKGTLGLGLVVSGVAVPLIIYGGGAAGLAIVSALVTGPSAQGLMDLVDREGGLIMAKTFIELSQSSRDELKASSYEKYIDLELKKENNNSSIVVTRDQVYTAYPYSDFKLNSIVDLTLKKVNDKRSKKSLVKLSYEEFQSEIDIMLQTNLFCQKRAETYRKVVRLLMRKLNS
jgi:hypothetical protein